MNAFVNLRASAGLSAAEVAELLDIDPAKIASYENGEVVPSPGILQANFRP